MGEFKSRYVEKDLPVKTVPPEDARTGTSIGGYFIGLGTDSVKYATLSRSKMILKIMLGFCIIL